MEDETKLNLYKQARTAAFSVNLPIDLNGKVEYIKKRTFLSKQRVILMSCAKNIEHWCKQLMDEELAIRTGGGKMPTQPVIAPPSMPVEVPMPIARPPVAQQAPRFPNQPPLPHQPGPLGFPITVGTESSLPASAPPFPQFKEDAFVSGVRKS